MLHLNTDFSNLELDRKDASPKMPPVPIQFLLAGPLGPHSKPRIWASGTSPTASPSRFWMPALQKVPPGCEDERLNYFLVYIVDDCIGGCEHAAILEFLVLPASDTRSTFC